MGEEKTKKERGIITVCPIQRYSMCIILHMNEKNISLATHATILKESLSICRHTRTSFYFSCWSATWGWPSPLLIGSSTMRALSKRGQRAAPDFNGTLSAGSKGTLCSSPPCETLCPRIVLNFLRCCDLCTIKVVHSINLCCVTTVCSFFMFYFSKESFPYWHLSTFYEHHFTRLLVLIASVQ